MNTGPDPDRRALLRLLILHHTASLRLLILHLERLRDKQLCPLDIFQELLLEQDRLHEELRSLLRAFVDGEPELLQRLERGLYELDLRELLHANGIHPS